MVRSKGQGREAEPSDGEENGSADQEKHVSDRPRRETYRVAIVGAAVGALATVLLAAIASPARDWVGGALDSVHDSLLGYNSRTVDNAVERIGDRPFWAGAPTFAQDSLDFLVDHVDDAEPISTLEEGSTSPRVVGVDELVTDAPELEGVPVVLVGKFYSRSTLGGEELDLTREEEILTGSERYAYVGMNDFTAADGFRGVVAMVGVLVATGRVQDADVPSGVETSYFISLAGVPVSPDNPVLRPHLAELLPAEALR